MRARERHYRRGGKLIAQPRREDRGHRDGGFTYCQYIDARGVGDARVERARGELRGIDRIDRGAIDALKVAADLGGVRQT